MAPRQVETEKLAHVQSAQLVEANPPTLQPIPKVFGYQHVMAHPFRTVPSLVQIHDEVGQNYAKVTRCHPATNHSTLEEKLYQDGTAKRLRFHKVRHPSSYPNLSPNSNSKPLSGERAPFHNYHLCIMISSAGTFRNPRVCGWHMRFGIPDRFLSFSKTCLQKPPPTW
jgi:hypothetical protein